MILEYYLERFSSNVPLIKEKVIKDIDVIVSIPVYNEETVNLERLLNSLIKAYRKEFKIELIFLVNEPEDEKEEVKEKHKLIIKFLNKKKKELEEENFKIYPLYVNDIPQKKFGIGYARKISCDEAIRRYEFIKKEKGILTTLDADCTVKENYFDEVIKTFSDYETELAHIYFEHPLEDIKDEKLKTGIIYYELFLRFYKNSLIFADYPYVSYTIGSCLAIRADTYARFGGFKAKRKAGEDFYFVQKILPHVKFTEIINTTVYPQARISERVPFGTGKALKDFIEGKEKFYYSLPFEPFRELKELKFFVKGEKNINELPDLLKAYLLKEKIKKRIQIIKNKTKYFKNFVKDFYLWFNLLKAFRFIRFYINKTQKRTIIEESVRELIKEIEKIDENQKENSPYNLLLYLRKYDKKNAVKNVNMFNEFYKKWMKD